MAEIGQLETTVEFDAPLQIFLLPLFTRRHLKLPLGFGRILLNRNRSAGRTKYGRQRLDSGAQSNYALRRCGATSISQSKTGVARNVGIYCRAMIHNQHVIR
jgi:hypothetical protein